MKSGEEEGLPTILNFSGQSQICMLCPVSQMFSVEAERDIPVNLTTSTRRRAAVDFSGVTSDVRLLRRADDYLMLNHSVGSTPVLCSLIAACAQLSFRFICRVANWHCKMPNKSNLASRRLAVKILVWQFVIFLTYFRI